MSRHRPTTAYIEEVRPVLIGDRLRLGEPEEPDVVHEDVDTADSTPTAASTTHAR